MRGIATMCKALALGIALIVSNGWPSWGAAVGDPLPALTLPEVGSGRPLDVAAHGAGGVLAVVFMQTSCAACRQELLLLKELQTRYPGLKVVAVCVDSGPEARVERYKEHFELPFVFVHDPDFKTPGLFGFSFTPGVVLADQAGRIAFVKGGYGQGDEAVLTQKVGELWGRQK